MQDFTSPNQTSEQNAQQQAGSNTQELETKLTACLADVQSWKDKYLRANADFQNFKRRSEKEQALWMQSAQAEIIKGLLPIIDDIDRALAESKKQELTPDMKAWLAGFAMIDASFNKLLKKYGVEEITEVTTFDPVLHEAVASVPAPHKKSGEIVEVLQKGFTFKNEVLRPAKVTVAQ
ncbi:MAG TPA: nucleotide exchange factor GrpE [Candidatus Babeliales bacterium]|nr:nucleotide exchange factor GrpE [Candidatus Babeliales bacterium]